MNDFDNRVAGIGRRRAIAFFVPRLAALAVLGAVLAVLLAGCAKAFAATTAELPYLSTERVFVYIDPETGCQYFRSSTYGGYMVPRIAADGKTHAGCKAVVR